MSSECLLHEAAAQGRRQSQDVREPVLHGHHIEQGESSALFKLRHQVDVGLAVSSPRAFEPNRDRCCIPMLLSSASCSRRVAITRSRPSVSILIPFPAAPPDETRTSARARSEHPPAPVSCFRVAGPSLARRPLIHMIYVYTRIET